MENLTTEKAKEIRQQHDYQRQSTVLKKKEDGAQAVQHLPRVPKYRNLVQVPLEKYHYVSLSSGMEAADAVLSAQDMV